MLTRMDLYDEARRILNNLGIEILDRLPVIG